MALADVVALEKLSSSISTITLNRPEKLNAMTFELVGQLHDALDEVAADSDCKVVVLTGAGRGFCAGLDLRDFGRPPAPGEHPRINKAIDGQAFMSNLTVHLRQTPQIVIAAVNGVAFGGGLAIACGCDVRIAADSARFCSAFIRTGLTGTDIGISYLLPQLIGASRAADLIFSGREVNAIAAERMGLVSEVVPSDELMPAALAYADMVAAHTHTGLVLTKEVLWHNVDSTSMPAAIAIENRNQSLAMQSPDVKAHMQAYTQRVAK
ncbi:MAG TPA: enoyl-CoA hydratase-related protein [Frankiaceae bacterium]|jgi:enoyl-CoA hydratase|nr:enoyl-CoA hydratase-related protein [Frankiaceae bacterium]